MSKDKNIKDYLHLYLGCEVQTNIKIAQGEHKPFKLAKAKLVDVDINGAYLIGLILENDTDMEIYQPNEVKLILRPLSDMTEEEFTEVVMIHWGISRDIIEQKISRIERTKEVKQNTKFGTSIPYVAFDKEGKHYMTATFSDKSCTPEQFQYLLSKHFDLFRLIESKLAIDKTTLK